MKIALIGRTEVLLSIGKYLAEKGHQLSAVITDKARPEYLATEADFQKLALKHNALFFNTSKLDEEIKEAIRSTKAEIGISYNWTTVIHQDFLTVLPLGILNGHCGELPKYRGNAVTNWAILQGESEIAFTVHKMEPGHLDSGDIYLQKKVALTSNSTIKDINELAVQIYPGMFSEVLSGLKKGDNKGIPQAQDRAFRCYPRLPRDGKIDWEKSATEIDALVRSLVPPYSGAYTYYRDVEDRLQKLLILKSQIVFTSTKDLGVPGHIIKNCKVTGESWVFCQNSVLAIQECSHENGVTFQPGKVWKSIRMRLGMDIEEEIFRLSKFIEAKGFN